MAIMNKASNEPGGSRQSFPSDVPYLVRRVLAPTTRLRAGALKVTLPDGRLVHLEGREPGPHAELILRDYRFARRLLASGEIGFGEGYLQGEWDFTEARDFSSSS